jgi:hypothetical protein
MATIGEDLFTILGIMPVRDRAGIQRDTMAGEAAKSAAAAPAYSAGAPMQMPAAPPKFQVPPEMRGQGGDLQLPENVPTEYASGKASPKTPMPTLPPGRERVIEAGPAAAPSPGVQKQASDVLLAAMEQRQRQQKMMQIIGHLGMMANAFNRNPDSQAATRESLSGMIGGGGGGGGAGLGDLKTILDMREKEQGAAAAAAARQRSINALVKQGRSLEDATVEVDNNLHTQRLGLEGEQKVEAIRRAEQLRIDLDKPEVIADLAARYHMSPVQMQALIRSGGAVKVIDPKDLAEIRDKHSTAAEREQKTSITGTEFGVRSEGMKNPDAIAARLTARLGRKVDPDEVRLAAATEETWKDFIKQNTQGGQAEIGGKIATTASTTAKTAEETRDTEQKRKADTAYAYYKDHPDAFARLHNLKDVDEARRIVDDRKAFDKYQETSGPSAYAGTAAYHDYERAERAAGRTPLGRLEFEKDKAKAGVPVPEDIGTKIGVEAAHTEMKKSAEEARQAAENVRSRHMLQEQWRSDLIAGGQLAEKQTELRSTVAQLFNMPDEQARDTKVFFSALNKNVQAAAKSLPGAFSNNDLLFMKDLEGGQTLDAIGIRKLQIIHEKMELAKIAKHDRYFESQTARPKLGHLKEYYDKGDVPEPGRFIRENMKANPQDVEALLKNPTPTEKKLFDKEYGYGRADWIIARGGKIDD